MEGSEYAGLEDAAKRILLKGGETLEVTLVSVTVAAQRHKLLSVVPASSERLWVIQLELIAEGIALVAAHAAAVVV